MKPLRIALTKGRLEKDTVNLLEQIGLDCTQVREKGRRLILPVGNGEIEVVLAKAADVITYVESRAMDVRIIKIEGSVELAPLLGLADGIVDIVETGTTLKENGLEVTETIAGISARLIANTASLKMRKQEIEALAARMEAQIEKNREEKSV